MPGVCAVMFCCFWLFVYFIVLLTYDFGFGLCCCWVSLVIYFIGFACLFGGVGLFVFLLFGFGRLFVSLMGGCCYLLLLAVLVLICCLIVLLRFLVNWFILFIICVYVGCLDLWLSYCLLFILWLRVYGLFGCFEFCCWLRFCVWLFVLLVWLFWFWMLF